jgi:heme-degrading monooxygenase HmoA
VILEKAILIIKPGQSQAFEAALRRALPLLAASPGFISLEVRPCVETPDRYLLLAQWQTVEAHIKGFRGSPVYQEWRALLHHFYDPFPTVEHYGEPIAVA